MVRLLILARHVYPGGLSFYKYLGSERHAERHQLFENNIVFTTYATVAKESANGNSALSDVHWYRLVLDEGWLS
jgi:SWI/SNF-related matrix-associated actin-dependent regulator of chromatin subfamily A3